MTNQNTQYPQKPVFYGELPQQEYDAVIVKATPVAPKPNMTPSINVLFLIDFPESVAFVSGFMNQTFKSGDKTSTWLKNLGIVPTSNVTPIDQLKGKRCKIYVTPGKKLYSQKYGRELQYHKIMALTPANSVIPSAVAPAQAPVAQPAPVQQPVQPVAQPVVQPMTQPVANNPFMNQPVTQPVAQPAIQPVYATPQVQPQPVVIPQGNNMAAQLAQVAQQAQATPAVNYNAPAQAVPVQPAPVQPAPVAQPVAQPLPKTTVSLDF